MEPSATNTTVTGPVGQRLQAGTENAPVLDRPALILAPDINIQTYLLTYFRSRNLKCFIERQATKIAPHRITVNSNLKAYFFRILSVRNNATLSVYFLFVSLFIRCMNDMYCVLFTLYLKARHYIFDYTLNKNFYCRFTTIFVALSYARARLTYRRRPSVRPSVTSRYHVKMTNAHHAVLTSRQYMDTRSFRPTFIP